MFIESYNIFWNASKYIYETEETTKQNSVNGLNYNRENSYWIYSNDYDYSTEEVEVLTKNDTTIYITNNNSNEYPLETIINDIEMGGSDYYEQTYTNVTSNYDTWSSYLISTINNFILSITENFTEKNKHT